MSENIKNFNLDNNWSAVKDFDTLKERLENNFKKLTEKGYLYKGDMGETPQIVNRRLYTGEWNGNIEIMPEWTELGLRLIDVLFKDDTKKLDPNKKPDHVRYMNKEDGTLNLSKLWTDGKLLCLAWAKTYAWWCADGDDTYPIYPASFFVYIDSTNKEARNDSVSEGEWIDDSCILIPGAVEYIDENDSDTNKDPNIEYSKSLVYPSFWYNANWGSRGAWCWKINGVQTDVPASVANDDGTTLGRMFIFKIDGNPPKYSYRYKNEKKWKTREEILNDGGRAPLNGDIGFCINENEEDSKGSKQLQIFTFTEVKDKVDGEWLKGGDLVTFDKDFYRMLWEYISEESKITIDQGKIILSSSSSSSSIKHCIFIPEQSGESRAHELCIRPFSSGASLDADAGYTNVDNAKLKIGYPYIELEGYDIELEGDVKVSGGGLEVGTLEVGTLDAKERVTTNSADIPVLTSDTINADSITINKSINAQGTINLDAGSSGSLSITSSKLNYIEPNGLASDEGKDGLLKVETPIEVTKDIVVKGASLKSLGNIVDKVFVHSSIGVDKALEKMGTASSSLINAPAFNINKFNWTSSKTGEYDGSGVKSNSVTVTLKSNTYNDFAKYTSFKISEPNGIGVILSVYGENSYGSSPDFTSGTLKINMVIEYNNGNSPKTMPGATISMLSQSIRYSVDPETKYITMYGAVGDQQLTIWSNEITRSQQIISGVYFTVEAVFNIETNNGTWGKQKTIYKTSYYGTVSGTSSTKGSVSVTSYAPSGQNNMFVITATGPNTVPVNETVARVCNDGIVIGSATNSALKIKFTDAKISITYAAGIKDYNILTMTPAKDITSDVFAIKQ